MEKCTICTVNRSCFRNRPKIPAVNRSCFRNKPEIPATSTYVQQLKIDCSNRYSVLQNNGIKSPNSQNKSVSKPKQNPPISKNHNGLQFCLWNARSLKQKTQLVNDYRIQKGIDMFLVTETWLKSDDAVEIGEVECNGVCRYLSNPREGRSGGGVGCLAKSNLKVSKVDGKKWSSFESMELQLGNGSQTITLVLIYRPEASVRNPYRMSDFFDEFTELLSLLNSCNSEFIVAGDFNIQMNKPNHAHTKKLNDIFDLFNLKQHVSGATHSSGNTLDLIITPATSRINNVIIDELNSDHHCILFQMNFQNRATNEKQISYRDTRHLNINKFKADLQKLLTKHDKESKEIKYTPEERLDQLIDEFFSITALLNIHAPLKTTSVRDRKPTPWTSNEIKYAKMEKRKAERKWRRSQSESDLEIYKKKRNAVNNLLEAYKSNHLSKKIQQHKGNSKALFKVINSCLHRKQQSPLPDATDDKILANEFNTYFSKKIHDIRAKLDTEISHPNTSNPSETVFKGQPLDKFKTYSKDEIRKIISCMSTKHCELDPIPTWLLKECLDELLPLITDIVNLSLQTGIMPQKLKHAVIKPLLKKPGQDLVNKNYRPVSNLTFLGKIIEGAVIEQFNNHLSANMLQDPNQSAYKKFHSTETLLTRIHNEVINKMSQGEVSMVVLLDLSAAFDTIDHKILISRLSNMYGIGGRAIEWFKSYIWNRTQSVMINSQMSQTQPLQYGVPQGSKLGPVLFNAYIAPVSSIAKSHNIMDEKYADDEQLILSFKPTTEQSQINATHSLEKCISDIRDFLSRNKLCNNGDKTEFMLIGNSNQLRKLKSNSITVNHMKITAVRHARNLGVIFDEHMKMEKQVNNMCSKAYFNIKNIGKIRKLLSKDDTKAVVNALVTPHLDYGNGLLHGINKSLLSKLQVAQNSAVRLIEKLRKRDHITEYRKNLHWLPIPARIEYKIMTTTWKILNNKAPTYLSELIRVKRDAYPTRSQNSNLLEMQNVTNKTAERAFCNLAPPLWNKLDNKTRNIKTLESFKKALKTHLFSKYYT